MADPAGGRSARVRQALAATRRRKIQDTKRQILAALDRHPERWWAEWQIRRLVKANVSHWRSAMTELIDQQMIQVSYPVPAKRSVGEVRAVYQAVPRRCPEQAPADLSSAHQMVLELLPTKGGMTLGTLTGKMRGAQPMTRTRAREIVMELYHAGQVQLRPAGATQVVKRPDAA